jgi:hypothetical protein
MLNSARFYFKLVLHNLCLCVREREKTSVSNTDNPELNQELQIHCMCGTEMYVKLSRQITFCTCEPDFPCGYQVRCSYYV